MGNVDGHVRKGPTATGIAPSLDAAGLRSRHRLTQLTDLSHRPHTIHLTHPRHVSHVTTTSHVRYSRNPRKPQHWQHFMICGYLADCEDWSDVDDLASFKI